MKDNRENDVLIDLFKRWREYIQNARPDIETVAESKDDFVSALDFQNTITESNDDD